MNTELFISYLLATIVIIAIPGPNILLIVNDSITHGFRKSTMTVIGIVSGMAVLFSLSLAGITKLLIMLSWLFSVIKWIGVCYLFYLGVSQILSSFKSSHETDEHKNEKRNFFTKGFLISVTNPKGLIFAGAFFPQFLNKNSDMISQIVILCGGFLLIAFAIGILYAFCGKTASNLFQTELFKKRVARISGAFLIFFGIGLAFVNDEKAV